MVISVVETRGSGKYVTKNRPRAAHRGAPPLDSTPADRSRQSAPSKSESTFGSAADAGLAGARPGGHGSARQLHSCSSPPMSEAGRQNHAGAQHRAEACAPGGSGSGSHEGTQKSCPWSGDLLIQLRDVLLQALASTTADISERLVAEGMPLSGDSRNRVLKRAQLLCHACKFTAVSRPELLMELRLVELLDAVRRSEALPELTEPCEQLLLHGVWGERARATGLRPATPHADGDVATSPGGPRGLPGAAATGHKSMNNNLANNHMGGEGEGGGGGGGFRGAAGGLDGALGKDGAVHKFNGVQSAGGIRAGLHKDEERTVKRERETSMNVDVFVKDSRVR